MTIIIIGIVVVISTVIVIVIIVQGRRSRNRIGRSTVSVILEIITSIQTKRERYVHTIVSLSAQNRRWLVPR